MEWINAGWVSKQKESKNVKGRKEKGHECPRRQRWIHDGKKTVDRLKQQ